LPCFFQDGRELLFVEIQLTGYLGKQLIKNFQLDKGKDPQHYGIGIKELWEIDPKHHQAGLVIHTAG